MRTIKFRGIEKPTKTFVYGCLCVDLMNETYIESIDDDVKRINTHWLVQGTEGQFTGLKDINEVDIYEGDILEFPFEMGIAYVINDGFRFAVKSPGSEAVDYEGEDVLKQTRVIGNIYQNPELLSTPTAVL